MHLCSKRPRHGQCVSVVSVAVDVVDDNQEDDNQMSFHSLCINRVEVAASSSGVSRVPVNGGDKKFVGARRRQR